MELSQLFMQLLSKGESAVSALEACNKELCKKMNGIYEPEDCIPYFFYTNEKREILRPNEAYDELVEFWQVYREFDADISEDIKKELWILEMLYETDNYRASCENKKRKEKLSKRQRKIIEKLCSVIKEVYGRKYLVLLDTDQDAYRVWEKIRLDRYGQEGNFFEDAHVENELMKLMDKGGLAVLVVGHGGLTPKRLYGVELHGGGFKRLKEAELEKLRSLVTAENKRASLDGNLRGCPEAFVEQSALLKHENK